MGNIGLILFRRKVNKEALRWSENHSGEIPKNGILLTGIGDQFAPEWVATFNRYGVLVCSGIYTPPLPSLIYAP